MGLGKIFPELMQARDTLDFKQVNANMHMYESQELSWFFFLSSK